MKEEKFQHVQKPLTGEDKGEFWNLRGEQSNRWSEAKQREFTTEFIAKQHFLAEKRLSCLPQIHTCIGLVILSPHPASLVR